MWGHKLHLKKLVLAVVPGELETEEWVFSASVADAMHTDKTVCSLLGDKVSILADKIMST